MNQDHSKNRRSRSSAGCASCRAAALIAVLHAVTGCHDGNRGAASSSDGAGAVASSPAAALVISTTKRMRRPANASVDYWMWLPSSGDPLDGTEAQINALRPALLRVGGYNSDTNRPDPFDHAQLDKAVAYARAVGAEPFIQVPLIADVEGNPPTAAEAAATVSYANISQGYGVKYFAIGNEPDLYAAQGAVADMSQPAFPGYTPADYCASVIAYAKAMKAVDPSIAIIGPQLSYKYESGNDWLSPVLADCGAVFDVVSIQRFPFSAVQASIRNAATDAASFRSTITNVRRLMTAAGFPDKPLAITGMNIAYDALPSGVTADAAPGTVGSALWLADIVGVAQELDVWTTVLWAISDPDDTSLGLLGPPPAHTPRPEYYAYALYADHFGPNLLEVTQTPAGLSAHAARNTADDATEAIVINWSSSPKPIGFEVTGLANAPKEPVFELPAQTMAAVEIPDSGAASAWIYGETQHRAATGPALLAPIAGTLGADGSDGGLEPSGRVCAAEALPIDTVSTRGTTTTTGLGFGSAAEAWGSFVFAGAGQATPTLALTADGSGFSWTGQIVAPLTNNYAGVGLYFSSAYCADASQFTGVRFDVSGNLGGCTLAFGNTAAADVSVTDDSSRGACTLGPSCYGPSADITASLADGLNADPTTPLTVEVPFASEGNGSPVATLDPSTLNNLVWRLGGTVGGPNGGACAASLTIKNVAFYR